MTITLKAVRNRIVPVACALGLLVTAMLLVAAAAAPKPVPVYYDVKAVAATYPTLPPLYCTGDPTTPRPRVRMEMTAVDTTTGVLVPVNHWSVSFQNTVAGIPDSQFPTGFDRNCLCEVPADFSLDGSGGNITLPLRYTGNGVCNSYATNIASQNSCVMPPGDYRFVAQAKNGSAGGAAVGVLQVRGSNICPDPSSNTGGGVTF